MRLLKTFLATTTLVFCTTPALAQEEEEPRTTYAVTMLDLADGADERWLEMRTEYIDPARATAGLPAETVHWVMVNGDHDIIIVSELPDGMATFDVHANPGRAAFIEALTELAGGEDALETLGDEMDSLVDDSVTYYTHTHP